MLKLENIPAAIVWIILASQFLGVPPEAFVQAFRFAWRPDTKVFPYDRFPTPSKIDNGDNDGAIILEYVPPQKVEKKKFVCIAVWTTNGACNRENNNEECDWDGGDCCRKSCKINCKKKELDPE
jgi:hypothetical protein